MLILRDLGAAGEYDVSETENLPLCSFVPAGTPCLPDAPETPEPSSGVKLVPLIMVPVPSATVPGIPEVKPAIPSWSNGATVTPLIPVGRSPLWKRIWQDTPGWLRIAVILGAAYGGYRLLVKK